jgi:hypothetical protein
MSLPVEAHRLRIAFDLSKYGEPVVEKRSAATPQIWRGNDLRIEVVIMDNGVILPVSNLASLTFEVRDAANLTAAPLMQKTVSSGDLDNTVTADDWEADTKEHAVFEFTDTETNLASPGAVYLGTWEETYYIVLHGVTTGGNIITYQTGALIFREDGSGSAGTPPTNDPNYYTMGQVDAGFVAKTGDTMTGLLVLSADPSAALGAATKQYVDAAGSNVGWKRPVRVASTANVTISGPGAAIDGVTLSNGDRVLLKDQSTGSQNGIYVFNGAASAMTRAADANTDGLMEPGLRVGVVSGTVNAGRLYYLATAGPITVGTTALTFTNPLAPYATTAAVAAGYQPLAANLTTWAGVSPSANGQSLVSAASYAAMRALLDLEVGTDFLSPSVITTALDLKAPLASPSFTGALTAGGGIRNSDGTVGAPAYSFTSETDMGIRRSGAGVMAHVFSGVDRLLLGESGNDILAQFPDYNFIINPSSTTAGRGNLGLWSPSGYGSGAGVIAMPMLSDRSGVTPTVNETDNLLLWADYIGSSPALWLKSAAVSHVIGGSNVNFFASDATFGFGIAKDTVGFYNNGAQVTTIGAHSDTTSLFPTLRRRKSRNTLASPNSLQSLDTIARDEALGFGGAAYQTAFRQDVIAAEAFGASAAGADVVWSTCPAGSATLTERLRLTSAGNWLFNGAAAPASLVNGHVLGNGTAPSADPTNAAVIVPVSGELQYRTAAASEGAGQNNRLHNRGAETEGSGTDTLSGSFTDVDFGAGALTLTLPAGTAFQVFAMIEFAAAGGAAESWTGQAQLVRGTSTIVINPHTINIARDASFDRAGTLTLMGVVTGIGNATLKLQALSASGLTVSRARIGYVRLY